MVNPDVKVVNLTKVNYICMQSVMIHFLLQGGSDFIALVETIVFTPVVSQECRSINLGINDELSEETEEFIVTIYNFYNITCLH